MSKSDPLRWLLGNICPGQRFGPRLNQDSVSLKIREKSVWIPVPSLFLSNSFLGHFRKESHDVITFKYVLVCFFIITAFIYVSVSVWVSTMYVQMPMEARRRHWILWSWNYGQLSTGAVLWVLGMELGSSGNAARTLTTWAISPVQCLLLANRKGKKGPTLYCNFIRKKIEGCYELITMGLRILKKTQTLASGLRQSCCTPRVARTTSVPKHLSRRLLTEGRLTFHAKRAVL